MPETNLKTMAIHHNSDAPLHWPLLYDIKIRRKTVTADKKEIDRLDRYHGQRGRDGIRQIFRVTRNRKSKATFTWAFHIRYDQAGPCDHSDRKEHVHDLVHEPGPCRWIADGQERGDARLQPYHQLHLP